MTDFQELIKKRVLALANEPLTPEEKAVMANLWSNYGQGKVTQLMIARSERWMGCHPKHEADIRANKMETTTRQVRQIIRDLRVKWEVPIISDVKGYWIVNSQEEAQEYLSRLEVEAKAQIKSWIETSDAMERALNIHNLFFTNIAAEL
jgi:hypothetical protein